MAQPRLWQQGHHPEAATVGGGIMRTAERPSTAWRRHRGCRQPSNRRGDNGATASTAELGRKLQRGSPKQIKPQGRDPLGGDRWRWWRLEAKATNPHGQKEERGEAEHMCHRAVMELAGARRSQARSSSAIQNRQSGLGLGTDREGERVRGRSAGLSRFGQAHLGGLTGGPRLSASLLI
jgi:hypothetical protein